MCEFKVFDQERLVAQDIVYAKVSNGKLILRDALHSAITVEETLVTEIDVANETMRLKKDPPIGDILGFLEMVAGCEKTGKHDNSLGDSWAKVKARGDETIRELWRRYGRPMQEKAAR